jgi:hypothetical protein
MTGRGDPYEALVALVRETGYASVTLDRLVRQTGELLAASSACLIARFPRDPDQAVVAAVYGVGEEHVGQVVPLAGDAPAFLAGGSWSPVPVAGGGRGRLEVAPGPELALDVDLLGRQADLVAAALEHAAVPPGLASDIVRETGVLGRSLDGQRPAGLGKAVEVELALAVADELALTAVDRVEVELGVLLYPLGAMAGTRAANGRPGGRHDAGADFLDAAADTVAHVPGLEAAATIVRHHEEHWDGTGLPAGLVGERIPVASRIVYACKAFAQLVAADAGAAALDYLRAGVGTRFAPDVVSALERRARERDRV